MLLGHLANRSGFHRTFLVGCLLAFALLLIPLSTTQSFWLAALLVSGIGFTARTTIPLTDTLAAGTLPDPVHGYGRVRAWGSIGFVVALLTIRVFGLVDERSPASMLVCMAAATVLCLGSSVTLRARPADVRPHGHVEGASVRAFDLGFWLFIAAAALHQLGMSAYYYFFTLYLRDALAMDNAAWVWALGTIAEIPMLFFAGRIIRRAGLSAMLMASMAAVSARFVVIALLPVLGVVLASQAFHALTFGLFHAACIEYVRRKVPVAGRGLAMGLYMSLSIALPSWVGSSIGGNVIERFGHSTLYLAYAVPPLLGIALLALSRPRLDSSSPSP